VTNVLLFHHAHGLTPGVLAFADVLRHAGHTVWVPDLYQGTSFDDLEAGVAHAEEVGFETIIERGVEAAQELPEDLVYVGLSLGVLPAQQLAQTRPGARGAVLVGSCVPPSALGSSWPDAVPVQIHGMDADEFFVGEGGDLDAARELVASVERAELFLYEGSEHLFVDRSLPSYDEDAARAFEQRVTQFLASVG
jgi:dienelactone hydrolase